MLEAFARVLETRAVVSHFQGLGALPHFNPDLDGESVPDEVANLRKSIRESDAVVISTPEYAHGLPGALKNALDWLVSDPAFAGKKIAIIHAERGSTWALDSLREVMRTMSAHTVEGACVGLRLETNKVTADALLKSDVIRSRLQGATDALLRDLREGRAPMCPITTLRQKT